jgi:hypothetical protein
MTKKESRSKNPKLQPFDVIEVPTPTVPKPPKTKEESEYSAIYSALHLILDTLILSSSVAWIACIVFYGTVPWYKSPVNAWYHTKAFKIFLAFGILWRWVFMDFIRSFLNRLTAGVGINPAVVLMEKVLSYISKALVLALGIFGICMVCVGDPIVRTCTRGSFPVHFKLLSTKNSVRGVVEVKAHDRSGIWDMAHYPLQSNYDIHIFSYLRDSEGKRDLFSNVTWPQESAVREMSYGMSETMEGRSDMMGYCGAQKERCLNGTVDLNPLRFEWTYTDPLTSEIEHTILESEGEWRFGRRHRPLVQLRDVDGDLVFSAPSSTVLCGGGDGDLRTAIVPVGFVMIAEQQYLGRY